METTNHTVSTSAANGRSSCHGGGHRSGGWLGNRRNLLIGGGAIVVALAVALGQHWLTLAALAPLLYVLPCALMMLVCMKGMNHGQQTGDGQRAADTGKPNGTGIASGNS